MSDKDNKATATFVAGGMELCIGANKLQELLHVAHFELGIYTTSADFRNIVLAHGGKYVREHKPA